MNIKITCIALLLSFPFMVSGQDIVHVKGISQIKVEDNLTKDLARQMVEELAMIDALNKSFGSYVRQETNIAVENGKVNYDIIGSTLVRGEWIRTTSIKFSEDIQTINSDLGKENTLWITCKIEGEARKITTKANLKALTLICPDVNCASVEFKNNQSLYLWFSTPVSGFLSVYIEEGDTTRRLFPYDSEGDKSFEKVEADKEYLLFYDNKWTESTRTSVDEIVLYTDQSIEYNTLHIVFSTDSYIKPFLTASVKSDTGYTIPRSISTEDFKEWLSECRMLSTDFQSNKIRISIRKK